jgi:hypothetical protein
VTRHERRLRPQQSTARPQDDEGPAQTPESGWRARPSCPRRRRCGESLWPPHAKRSARRSATANGISTPTASTQRGRAVLPQHSATAASADQMAPYVDAAEPRRAPRRPLPVRFSLAREEVDRERGTNTTACVIRRRPVTSRPTRPHEAATAPPGEPRPRPAERKAASAKTTENQPAPATSRRRARCERLAEPRRAPTDRLDQSPSGGGQAADGPSSKSVPEPDDGASRIPAPTAGRGDRGSGQPETGAKGPAR